jgi:hypothetical protein
MVGAIVSDSGGSCGQQERMNCVPSGTVTLVPSFLLGSHEVASGLLGTCFQHSVLAEGRA